LNNPLSKESKDIPDGVSFFISLISFLEFIQLNSDFSCVLFYGKKEGR